MVVVVVVDYDNFAVVAAAAGGPFEFIADHPPQFRSHSIDGTQMARTALSGLATRQRSITDNTSSNCFAVDALHGTEQQCSARQRMNAVPTVKIFSKKQCFPPECCYTQCSTDALQKCHDDDDAQQAADAVQLRSPNCFFFFSSSFCPPPFRHILPPKMLLRLSLLFLFAVGQIVPGGVSATARSRRTLVPLGMDKQMFPPQIFDENAPICTAEREPCGFYSFSLDGKAPLKWIKSWCRCSAQHECVYERTDMRMRVYRQTCIAHDDLLPADDDDAVGEEEAAEISAAQRQQQSVVLVETVVPSTATADRDRHGNDDAAVVAADGDEDHPQRTHRHHHHKHHRSSNRHHHRHGVVAASAATTVNNASRHSRKTHRQRQVIRRLRELD